jgi:hypothetical protein
VLTFAPYGYYAFRLGTPDEAERTTAMGLAAGSAR